MSRPLTPDSQAILLLTSPLIVSRGEPVSNLLTPSEYKRLDAFLGSVGKQPGDLLSRNAEALLRECQSVIDADRMRRLLGRGFLLGQAIERWQARAIWVVTRADADYPTRLTQRLQLQAPWVLYGCGDVALLDRGGLAVVGSRNVDDALLTYSECVGHLAANADQTIISGGARGIDESSMRGALKASGRVVGVLADGLERASLNREYREPIMQRQLVLISPYDPAVGFNVGNAMQRNKLIYALSDAALVVNSDYEKGGTWAGASEQLRRLRLVPVFVRSRGVIGKGLEELQKLGARPWPNPRTPLELKCLLSPQRGPENETDCRYAAPFTVQGGSGRATNDEVCFADARESVGSSSRATRIDGETLVSMITRALGSFPSGATVKEVAASVFVGETRVRRILERLAEQDKMVERTGRPARYRLRGEEELGLFDEMENRCGLADKSPESEPGEHGESDSDGDGINWCDE